MIIWRNRFSFREWFAEKQTLREPIAFRVDLDRCLASSDEMRGAYATFRQASVFVVQRRQPTMNNDLLTIALVVLCGGALSYVGLLASQFVEKKHELKEARIDARRFGQHIRI